MGELEELIENFVRNSFKTQKEIRAKEVVEEINKQLEKDNGVSKEKIGDIIKSIEFEAVYDVPFYPSKKSKRLKRIEKLREYLL